MRTLIKDGIIVNSDATSAADILIQDRKISAVGSGLSAADCDNLIDAADMYIFPGGVDPHVHMHLPSPAGYSSDDFLTGSRAALYGGTTTIIDFVTPEHGESLPGALEKRMREAENSLTDYSFHVSPVEWRSTTEDEIRECITMGVTSFKVYMAYKNTVGLDDEDLARVMKAVGNAGGIVAIHCEQGDEIEKLRTKFSSKGNTSPLYHALSRPAHMEAEAVRKAIEIAGKASCPLYIVHASSRESLVHISNALTSGQKVFAETCPQYLLLDDSKYKGTFEEAAPFVISPPLRTPEDNKALWQALADGTISTVGTDHCPFTMAQKLTGLNDFRLIPGGAGGVEHRMALLCTYGALTKRLNINQIVNIASAAPSEIFGLSPRKGKIMTGSDADLVIWNPATEDVISAKTHHQDCDINIYEGMKVKGYANYVMRRGEIIIEKGRMKGSVKPGEYLSRTLAVTL